MKKHLERQSKDAYEVNQENGEWFPVFEKTKTIDEIIENHKEMFEYYEIEKAIKFIDSEITKKITLLI